MKNLFAIVAVAAIAYVLGTYSTLDEKRAALAYSAGRVAGLAEPRAESKKETAKRCIKWWFTGPPHLKGQHV